eukprot:TRINITY_DN1315_c0_g1_i5.p1 TRINITY_DN1315_c0_g1~~TRINITY_DN1315_c0_g1_i5.p1  ORF type:complete len:2433 (-),score=297.95 TRINITY_DN1315_c0_g1_i5:18-6263(-)
MTESLNGWGVTNMDRVIAHETGHIFGARDEYCQPGYSCCKCGGSYGYLGVGNDWCEAACYCGQIGGTCNGCTGNTCYHIDCMMRNNSWKLCQNSINQIGWRDSDGDGILDPVAATPSISISTVSSGALSLTAMGSASESSSNLISYVRLVECRALYSSSGASASAWVAAVATDGKYDGYDETWQCDVTVAAAGSYIVQARVWTRWNMPASTTSTAVAVCTVVCRTTIVPCTVSGSGQCISGVCQFTYLASGTSCDDGDNCTLASACNAAHQCAGTQWRQCVTPGFCESSPGTCTKGVCVYSANVGAACDDGDACTSGTKCDASKSCTGGTTMACTASGPCIVSGSGHCASGICQYTYLVAGASCNDADNCTASSVCNAAHQCVGTQCVTPGFCEASHGTCTNGACMYAANVGAACDDGDACTTGTMCNAQKQCVGTTMTCAATDPCIVTGSGHCASGVCKYTYLATDASCDDHDSCTASSKCNAAHQCVGTRCITPGFCEAAPGTCTNGVCVYSANVGASCDDGDNCTSGTVCQQNKQCTGGSRLTCDATGPCIENGSGVCDAKSNTCKYTYLHVGQACDDGDACTSGTVCNANHYCVGGTTLTCNDEGPCTAPGSGHCVAGICQYAYLDVGDSCEDGDLCTATSECNKQHECVGARCTTPGSCEVYPGTCTDGACVYSADVGAECDDGDACTTDTTCDADKQCTGGTQVICDATGPCTASGQCIDGECEYTYLAVGASCEDADKQCTGGTQVICDATGPCTASGQCIDGECEYTYLAVGASCEDEDNCTTSSRCNSAHKCVGLQCVTPGFCEKSHGSCVGGTCVYDADVDASCDDGDACTSGTTCDSAKQCTGGTTMICDATDPCLIFGSGHCVYGICKYSYLPVGTSCDDGDNCTESSTCDAAHHCLGIKCATPGFCEGASGICVDGACVYSANTGAKCDDGDPCTSGTKCDANKHCTGGTTMTCSASDPCIASGSGHCVSGVCQYTYLVEGASCDDGDSCTAKSMCNEAHQCVGTQCVTPGFCEVSLGNCVRGACVYAANVSAACDDGDACTSGTMCNAQKKCTGGYQMVCDATSPCIVPNSGRCMTGVCAYTYLAVGASCDDGDNCTTSSVCNAVHQCVGERCVTPGFCEVSHGTCVDGSCVYSADVGAACDDGNACTSGSTCTSEKQCAGGTTMACDEYGPCTVSGSGHCVSGVCEYSYLAVRASCDDSDNCTASSMCNAAHECVGAQCTTPGFCEGKPGICTRGACVYLADVGATCDDGDACTSGTVCNAEKQCTGGTSMVCDASGPCTASGSGRCVNGVCEYTYSEVGTSCDDSDPCTAESTCDEAHQCVGPQCITPGFCEAYSGICENGACVYPAAVGVTCDDGDNCTSGTKCDVNKKCTGGDVLLCAATGPCIYTGSGVCDPVSRTCMYTYFNVGQSCDDGDACTFGTVCDTSHNCVGGTTMACNNEGPCTIAGSGRCVAGICEYFYWETGAICDDGDNCTNESFCNATHQCVGTQCVTPGFCEASPGVCSAGACEYSANVGSTCDDGDNCTSGKTCSANKHCTRGIEMTCDVAGPCIVAGSGGCVNGVCEYAYLAVGATCDDNDPCTSFSTCNAAHQCVGARCATPGFCEAHPGTCTNGTCVYPANLGATCDDGDACTRGTLCDANKQCIGGTRLICDATGPCIYSGSGVCAEESNTCLYGYFSVGQSCDDRDACTSETVCDASHNCVGGITMECNSPGLCEVAGSGHCIGGACVYSKVKCNAGGPCTEGNCSNGECSYWYVPEGNPCDDRDPCTGGTTCDAFHNCSGGAIAYGEPCESSPHCVAGGHCGDCIVAADCDDGDSCTADVCANYQCSHQLCPFAGAPYCVKGQCVECRTAADCIANDTCHTAVCVSGVCRAEPRAEYCQIGDQCYPANSLVVHPCRLCQSPRAHQWKRAACARFTVDVNRNSLRASVAPPTDTFVEEFAADVAASLDLSSSAMVAVSATSPRSQGVTSVEFYVAATDGNAVGVAQALAAQVGDRESVLYGGVVTAGIVADSFTILGVESLLSDSSSSLLPPLPSSASVDSDGATTATAPVLLAALLFVVTVTI